MTKRKLDEDDEFEDHVNLNSVRRRRCSGGGGGAAAATAASACYF